MIRLRAARLSAEPEGQRDYRAGDELQVMCTGMFQKAEIQGGVRTQVIDWEHVTYPQKGQFRGECAARTRRGQGDGEAKATRHCVTRFSIHCSRSLNLALAASRPVMTGVSSSSFAKSLALANARDLLTGCSSWTRWSRTSTPEVRYKMHPT